MLQPSVVEVVSATFAGSTCTTPASAARACPRSASISRCRACPPRPRSRSASWRAFIASIVGRATGPIEPAFRYATARGRGTARGLRRNSLQGSLHGGVVGKEHAVQGPPHVGPHVQRACVRAADEDVVDRRAAFREAVMAEVGCDVEVAGQHDRLVALGELEHVGRGALDLLGGVRRRLRRVQVREEKARETDDLADPRLRRAASRAPCVGSARRRSRCSTSRSRRTRIAFPWPVKSRPEVAVVQRGDEPVERPRHGRGPARRRRRPPVMPLHSSSRRSDQTGSSWRQTTSGPSHGDEANHLFEIRVPPRRAVVFPWNRFQLRISTGTRRLLYGPPMRRFEDLIERQIAIFCEDYADLMTACTAAERAYDRAGADEAEERYAAYLELVEEAARPSPTSATRTRARSTRMASRIRARVRPARSRGGFRASDWVSEIPRMGRSAHCDVGRRWRSSCRESRTCSCSRSPA